MKYLVYCVSLENFFMYVKMVESLDRHQFIIIKHLGLSS